MRPFDGALDWIAAQRRSPADVAERHASTVGRRGDAGHAGVLRCRRRHATTTFDRGSRVTLRATRRSRHADVSRARWSHRIPRTTPSSARWFPAAGEPPLGRAAGPRPGRRRAAAVELRRRGAHRAVAAARPIRRLGAATQPALSRRAHAARADARRLHRQLEHRADGAGLPPGGARRAARGGVAGVAGLRADRHPRHEPRVVPGDADVGARAAASGRRRSITSRRGSPTSCGAGSRRGTCAQGSRGTSTSIGCARLWRPISPWSYLERVGTTQTLLVYAKYDLTFPVDLSRMLVDEFRAAAAAARGRRAACGHYSTGAAPFKYVDGYVLTRFLRRTCSAAQSGLAVHR